MQNSEAVVAAMTEPATLASEDAHPPIETAIAEYRPLLAGLAELRHRYGGIVFDLTTTQGEEEARRARQAVRSVRTRTEDVRVEIKAAVLERGRAIDADAKMITAAIREIEDPIDAQIKAKDAEREAERQRKLQEIADATAAMRREIVAAFPGALFFASGPRRASADIREHQAQVEAAPVSAERYGDLMIEAQEAKVAALGWLADELAEALQLEAEQAELERQRAALEAERQADRERQAQERAAAEAQRQAEEAARAEARRIEDVERQRQDEERRQRLAAEDAERAAEAERLRIAREELDRRQAEQDREQHEKDRRDAAERHRQAQERERQEALALQAPQPGRIYRASVGGSDYVCVALSCDQDQPGRDVWRVSFFQIVDGQLCGSFERPFELPDFAEQGLVRIGDLPIPSTTSEPA